MSKYNGLGTYLRQQFSDEVPMSFAEIETLTGTKLPPSAYRHRPWWSNNASNSVMTKIWLEAGFRTAQVDMEAKTLVFKRGGAAAKGYPGMDDGKRVFKSAETDAEKKPRRHPAFGALKGTFTIEPGYDVTQPVYSPEEWAEIEAEMEASWDRQLTK
jgi:hypothetical protein